MANPIPTVVLDKFHQSAIQSKTLQSSYPDHFHNECLQGSAIAPDLYESAIDFLEDQGRWEIHQALNLDVSQFWVSRKPHDFGVLACLRNEDGTLWQGKPEFPMMGEKGKAQKYQAPKGNGSRAYFPPVPGSIREAIAKRYGVEVPLEGSFWDWLAVHPEIQIVITEGGKKALSLLSLGYVAIAVYGVNAGYRVNDALGNRLVRPVLIPDLERFTGNGRSIVLAFDQDAATTTRQKVAVALSRFGEVLQATGSTVRIATWDQAQGKGVDDLITCHGAEAWGLTHGTALPLAQANALDRLSKRVKRTPDLNIGNQEFKAVTQTLPKTGILALHGAKGSGKSEGIAALIGDRKWLSFAPLRSVARDQAESWGGVFLQDGDRYGSQVLGKDGHPVAGASVCFPSLLASEQLQGEVLVLDETTAGMEFILGSKLCNHQGIRPLLLAEFARRVKAADLVILADADLTESAITYIEALRGERAYLVKSERKPLGYPVHLLTGKKNQAIAEFLDQVQAIPEGKLVYLNSDSKALVDGLETILKDQGLKTLKITQETSGEELQRRLTESKGAVLPELAMMGIKVILSSPSITQGFSIQYSTDRILNRWGIYSGGSISAAAIAQSPDRVRSDCPLYLWVAEKGSAYSRLGRSLNPKQWLSEFKTVRTASARLVQHSLNPSTAAAVDGLDWGQVNLKALASIEVSRNLGMIALRDTVVAHLLFEGKQVKDYTSELEAKTIRAAGQAMKAAAAKLKTTYAEQVEGALTLSDVEAKAMEKRSETETLTPEERLALEKYYLASFYRLETVQSADVLRDRNGRTRRQVRNLETVLNSAKAQALTAESMDRNTSTPQDWSKAAVQSWLIEQSGAGNLIRGIMAGEVVELSEDVVTPINDFITAHPREFAIAFSWGGGQNLSPMRRVGLLLDWVGIDRTTRRKREGQTVARLYRVNEDTVQWLTALLNRRSKGDPLGCFSEVDQPSGSAQNPLSDGGLKEELGGKGGGIDSRPPPDQELWGARQVS